MCELVTFRVYMEQSSSPHKPIVSGAIVVLVLVFDNSPASLVGVRFLLSAALNHNRRGASVCPVHVVGATLTGRVKLWREMRRVSHFGMFTEIQSHIEKGQCILVRFDCQRPTVSNRPCIKLLCASLVSTYHICMFAHRELHSHMIIGCRLGRSGGGVVICDAALSRISFGNGFKSMSSPSDSASKDASRTIKANTIRSVEAMIPIAHR